MPRQVFCHDPGKQVAIKERVKPADQVGVAPSSKPGQINMSKLANKRQDRHIRIRHSIIKQIGRVAQTPVESVQEHFTLVPSGERHIHRVVTGILVAVEVTFEHLVIFLHQGFHSSHLLNIAAQPARRILLRQRPVQDVETLIDDRGIRQHQDRHRRLSRDQQQRVRLVL